MRPKRRCGVHRNKPLPGASFAFGECSDHILIGNFGDRRIHAVTSSGLELLYGHNKKPIVIDGLWAPTLGGG